MELSMISFFNFLNVIIILKKIKQNNKYEYMSLSSVENQISSQGIFILK
jgi:hypothetical protein